MKRVKWLPGIVAGSALLLSVTYGCQSEQTASSDGARTTNVARAAVEVECDVDLGLTKESGTKIDWMDEARTWSVSVDNGRITLARQGSCGDECGFFEEIVLDSGGGGCPTFVSASVVQREAMSPKGMQEKETLATEGRVQIQDWDLERGVFSGKVQAEVEFTFYGTLDG